MKLKTTKRAVLYCRVSTAEQAVEGISLEGQELELRAYCRAAGLDVVEVVVDDGVSAFKPLANRAGRTPAARHRREGRGGRRRRVEARPPIQERGERAPGLRRVGAQGRSPSHS